MSFGLTNTGQAMRRLMGAIIPPDLKSRVFVYLDALLFVSETFAKYISLLETMADILKSLISWLSDWKRLHQSRPKKNISD